MSEEKLGIVTEIGTFGSLNIEDPTVTDVVTESIEELKKKKKKQGIAEEEIDMTELANEILNK